VNEKERILILAVFSFLFLILVSVLDGWFTVMVFQPQEWQGLHYWLYVMGVVVSVASFGLGFASLLGDYGIWSYEDYFALVLLTVQPWILIWGGVLDAVSRTVQGSLWGEASFAWVGADFAWTWLDPPVTSGVPILPYLISRMLGYINTMSVGLVLGSFFSILIVVALWAAYFYES